MKKKFVSTIIAMATAALAAPAFATTTTIDFEAFDDGQNLNGVNLGGVTITNPSGNVEIYDNRFGVSSNSGTKAIGSFTSTSSINPMIFTFHSAVSFVELFAGDAGNGRGAPPVAQPLSLHADDP